jgi:hypothetical protein
MRSSRRIFYVVYSRNEHDQDVFDAIRYLADPTEKTRAHVTVRGPYPQKHAMPAVRRDIEGSEVFVKGVDAFLEPGQNTVFFALDAPSLAAASRKPDFPDHTPHLTIYDGKSREFAVRLKTRLQKIHPSFRFQAGSLKALVTKKGQGSIELKAAYDEDLVASLTGQRVAASEVPNLSEEKRIELIAKICLSLASSGNSQTQTTKLSVSGSTPVASSR